MTLRLVDDLLPDANELEEVAHELLNAGELLAPRRLWSVDGMVEPLTTPVLDAHLDAAPSEFHDLGLDRHAWTRFFSGADRDFVRRQSEASLQRVIQLDGVPTPRPDQLVLRLSEPLLSRDRQRVLSWANLLQPRLREGRWELYVHRLGELAFDRVEGQWEPSPDAPKTCRAFSELER